MGRGGRALGLPSSDQFRELAPYSEWDDLTSFFDNPVIRARPVTTYVPILSIRSTPPVVRIVPLSFVDFAWNDPVSTSSVRRFKPAWTRTAVARPIRSHYRAKPAGQGSGPGAHAPGHETK